MSPSAGAQAAIVFIKEPSSQDALQGRRALLRCEVETPGPVHVYWLLDGAPVQDTERRFAQGSSLSFAAVDRLQDSGAFQCVARDNATGEEARSANASFNIKCESQGAVLTPYRPSTTEPCRTPPFPQLLPFPVKWGQAESSCGQFFEWIRKVLFFPEDFFSFKSRTLYVLDAFANGKGIEGQCGQASELSATDWMGPLFLAPHPTPSVAAASSLQGFPALSLISSACRLCPFLLVFLPLCLPTLALLCPSLCNRGLCYRD